MQATCISTDLAEYLIQNDNTMGNVHSIFAHAVNIEDGSGQFITLLSPNRPMQPMSMKVEVPQWDKMNLEKEDQVTFHHHGILLVKSKRFFNTYQSKKWSPDPSMANLSSDMDRRKSMLDEIGKVMLEQGNLSGIAPMIKIINESQSAEDVNDYVQFIKQDLMSFMEDIQDKKYEEALSKVHRIIGFGPGLTPSTDDFLAGVLSSLFYEYHLHPQKYKGLMEFMREIYKRSINRTTKVSEMMLQQASKGWVNEDYRTFLQHVFTGEEADEEVYSSVLRHGSTSGTDFMFGVYYMNKIFLEQNKEDEE